MKIQVNSLNVIKQNNYRLLLTNFLYLINKKKYQISFITIVLISFLIRLINLNYNVPFNDEAISIIVGKLGLFQHDWGSYNALTWMGGLPYTYPVLSAISYALGGIAASRFINVVFFIFTLESIFTITVLLSNFKDEKKYLSGIIAAIILSGASISYYVSRLATYDMPSFAFLFLGITSLLLAENSKKITGKWYFLSSIALLISFSIKIIVGLYIPILFIYSFVKARSLGKKYFYFWSRYFPWPLLIGLTMYILFNFSNLKEFYYLQTHREYFSLQSLLLYAWDKTNLIWGIGIIGTVGMIIAKDLKKLFFLTFLAVVIILFQLIAHRQASFDKHLFITLAFISIISGLGISELLQKIIHAKLYVKILSITFSIVLLFSYLLYSYTYTKEFDSYWTNSQTALTELQKVVKSGDTLLVESGASPILSLYNKNIPSNITTFDYLTYQKLQGKKAYVNALNDGYFNYIELENTNVPKDTFNHDMHALIFLNLNSNYSLIYQNDTFQIYTRNY